MTTGFAQRINALHGETGQILHVHSLSGRPALRGHSTAGVAEAPLGGPNEYVERDSAVVWLWCQEKRLQWIVVWLRPAIRREESLKSSGDEMDECESNRRPYMPKKHGARVAGNSGSAPGLNDMHLWGEKGNGLKGKPLQLD